MPTPQGQITSSEIFNTPEVIEEPKVLDKKEYKITFTRNSIKSTVVTASSKEEALTIAQFRVSGNALEYDELIQEFDPSIEEL
jgi:hypothetical protein